VLLDVGARCTKTVCFRVDGTGRVCRRDYVVIDRERPPYLTGLKKANCVYCGYAKGVIAYVREIAVRTEQYWCPIEHARRLAKPHEHYGGFATYGDRNEYRRSLDRGRRELAHEGGHHVRSR
jgi:hypothetical protein